MPRHAPNPTATPPALPSTFTDGLPLPRALVFDLDYTLWPFWVDTHVTPPLKPDTPATSATNPGTRAGTQQSPSYELPGSAARDRHGMRLAFYPEVPGILAAARARGMKIAAASRTHTPDLAAELLRLLQITEEDGGKRRPAREFFDCLQIFPGSKVRHLSAIGKKLGVEYQEMVFFDDEGRNRDVERELGVLFVLVEEREGVTGEVVDRGVRAWRKRRGVVGS